MYQCHLLPTWIKKIENHKSDICGEKKISYFIVRVNKRVQFWAGILDLMLILLTRQEQTLTDTDVEVSFLGLPFSILFFPFFLHTLIIFFKLCFGASHAPSILIYIGKVVGVLLSTNPADLVLSPLSFLFKSNFRPYFLKQGNLNY